MEGELEREAVLGGRMAQQALDLPEPVACAGRGGITPQFRLEVWWELPPDAQRADLEAAMRGIVSVYRGHMTLMAAVVDAASYDVRVRERFGELIQRARRELASHIADGQRRGFVRRDLDAAPVAGWLTWMGERGLYQLVRFADDEATVERLTSALSAIVWNTLYDGAR